MQAASPGLDFALRVPILMYHRIVDPALAGRSLPQLVVPPELFAAQMAMLRQAGWQTIGMSTLACDFASGTRPPPKTFVVTFDDGYSDGYTQALPILRRFGFVATYYIVTGRIGWPGQLTRADVRALAADGMDIGDHTVDHVNLNGLSAARLVHEIAGAAQAILATIGKRPVTFAYPFGDRSARVVRAVASAGFDMAVTNQEGDAETRANEFQVPRVRVGPATTPVFLLDEIMAFTR
jgi:peptidoglycan/xylan/chitin deacetylase (PgdA/CDA1 family)